MEKADGLIGEIVDMFVVLILCTLGKIAYQESAIHCDPKNLVLQLSGEAGT